MEGYNNENMQETEGNWGSGGLPPEKYPRSRPLECHKTPFCKMGYKLPSSLIFMLEGKLIPKPEF